MARRKWTRIASLVLATGMMISIPALALTTATTLGRVCRHVFFTTSGTEAADPGSAQQLSRPILLCDIGHRKPFVVGIEAYEERTRSTSTTGSLT
jgi:hypothetical protein